MLFFKFEYEKLYNKHIYTVHLIFSWIVDYKMKFFVQKAWTLKPKSVKYTKIRM